MPLVKEVIDSISINSYSPRDFTLLNHFRGDFDWIVYRVSLFLSERIFVKRGRGHAKLLFLCHDLFFPSLYWSTAEQWLTPGLDNWLNFGFDQNLRCFSQLFWYVSFPWWFDKFSSDTDYAKTGQKLKTWRLALVHTLEVRVDTDMSMKSWCTY